MPRQRDRNATAAGAASSPLAIELQWQLIEELSPRDNIIGQVLDDDEVVPF